MAKRGQKPTDPCQYKEKCVRKNPHHFMEYAHEHLENIIKENQNKNEIENYNVPAELMTNKAVYLDQIKIINDLFSKTSPEPSAKRIKIEKTVPETKSKMKPIISAAQLRNALNSISRQTPLQKLNAAKPYNYFLTAIESSPQTHTEPLSITFQELLHPSLGDIEWSVQINFVVEMEFLLRQYTMAGCSGKPLFILHGDERIPNGTRSQVTTHFIKMNSAYATHHTKMMLFGYKDGSMRVIVSTANLFEEDWRNHVQGLWISDRLPPIKSENKTSIGGESVTGFRNDLAKYLEAYKLAHLNPFIERIRNADFSSVNVFLVTSIPGTSDQWTNDNAHGYSRVQWLLQRHCEPINDTTPLVVQCSTFGNLGAAGNGWLNEFKTNLCRDSQSNIGRKMSPIQIIYPTKNNVLRSYDGAHGGGSLLYDRRRHEAQQWLNEFLYQWRANERHRTRAMPHIKTYARFTDQKLHWFILTSANLSKSAWGWQKTKKKFEVSNYEAGVLFLPKFVTKTKYFAMDASDQTTPVFPKVYDIPLIRYQTDDRPFFREDVLDDVLPNGCPIA